MLKMDFDKQLDKYYRPMWNMTNGATAARYISDDMHRSGVKLVVDGPNAYKFRFCFYYKSDYIKHVVHISFAEVINKFNGDLADAIIQHEYIEFLKFKAKIQEAMLFKEDDADIAETNRINRVKTS